MSPLVQDFKFYAGQTDRIVFWLKDGSDAPINLTGVIVSAYLTDGVLTYQFLTSNGKVIVTPLEGKIEIVVGPDAKVNLQPKVTYACKIQWTNGDISRILEGDATIIPEK